MQSIAEIQEKLSTIVNVQIHCPKIENKGAVGHLLEEKVGILRSSACLDCIDGEIKTVPLKKLQNGKLVPKESIAVTMMEKEFSDFEKSRCFKKMQRMLVIPYLRDGDNVVFYSPTLIELTGALFELIKADYDLIRNSPLQSKIGKYLQTRTKGPGGSNKTRGFYLRPLFMREFVNF
jgi:hypothetical protein